MKVFACVMALCLIAAVYCQAPAGNQAAMLAAAAAAGGGQGMMGGTGGAMGGMRGMGGGNGGLGLMALLGGGLGSDSFRRYYMCNMLTGGTNSMLCMSSLMS